MDFFHIDFLGIHMDRFAVFNVADASVSTGIVLMLLFYKKFADLDKFGSASADETKIITDLNSAQDNLNEQKSGMQSSSSSQ
jgi:hypothetical protein